MVSKMKKYEDNEIIFNKDYAKLDVLDNNNIAPFEIYVELISSFFLI